MPTGADFPPSVASSMASIQTDPAPYGYGVAVGRTSSSPVNSMAARDEGSHPSKLPSAPPSASAYIRRSELQVLVRRFAASMKKKLVGGAVVTGATGMGVSTLLKHLRAQIVTRMDPSRVFYMVSRELDDPFFPFSHILRKMFGADGDDVQDQLQASIVTQVGALLEGTSESILEETTHLLGYMAGVPFPQSPVLRALQRDPEQFYKRLKDALVRYFNAALTQEPATLIFDDVHRLSRNSRSRHLLQDIMTELQTVPFFIVLGGGIELNNFTANPRFPLIHLAPHDESVMRTLFSEMVPKLQDPPEQLVSTTVKRAAGNPGALYELCSLLQESGAIDTTGEVWSADISKLNIPAGPHDALRARFEQLDPRDKLVLQTASVFGDIFWDEVIVAMSRVTIRLKTNIDAGQIWADDSDGLAIASSLDRLVERKFLAQLSDRDGDGAVKYAFARSGIREKIIATVDPDRQRMYHFLAAEWLKHSSTRYGRVTAELETNHWLAAGDTHRAAAACFRAARGARGRYLNQKAVELFTKGLELASEDERLLRIDALHDLGSLYELQGRIQDAEECFKEMLRNAWILAHRGKAGAALNKIGRLHRSMGDGPAARAFFNRSMTLFKAAGDEVGLAACLGDLGELARQEGSFDRAYKLVREAFEIQRKHQNRRSMAVSLQCLGKIEVARTSFERAERYFLEALEMMRKTNDRGGMAQTLTSLASMMANRGDLDGAVKRFEASLELAKEVGDRRMQAVAHNHLGEAFREQRKFKDAMAHFKDCEEVAMAQNDRHLYADVLRNLAILAMRMGDLEMGHQHVVLSLDIARQIGAKEIEALCYRALGELHATTMWDTSKTDSADEAVTYFQLALDSLRSIGNQFEMGRTLHALGNRLLERGDLAASRRMLKEAKEIFEHVNAKISDDIERTISETADHAQGIEIDS